MPLPPTIVMLSAQHPTSLPSFAIREDLVVAYAQAAAGGGVKALRVFAAALGACCPGLAAQARITWQAAGWDVLAYGDRLYSFLRESGASAAEIAEAGGRVITDLAGDLFPREPEVKEAVGFSEGGEARSTSSPSA